MEAAIPARATGPKHTPMQHRHTILQPKRRLLHVEVDHEANIPHVGLGDNRPSPPEELLGV